MQELSSMDQRHLENQTEGEPSNENDQLTPEQPGWSRRKRRQKGRACAKQQTNFEKNDLYSKGDVETLHHRV